MVTMREVTRRDHRLPEAEWFGRTVRRLREDRGLTQAQLAEAAQLSSTYLGIIERGENAEATQLIQNMIADIEITPRALARKVFFWKGRGKKLLRTIPNSPQ